VTSDSKNRCANPHCGQPAATNPRRKGLCTACASYRRRYHRDRPAHTILAAYNRTITRLETTHT